MTVKYDHLLLTEPFLCHISPPYFNYRQTQFAFLDWWRRCYVHFPIFCATQFVARI